MADQTLVLLALAGVWVVTTCSVLAVVWLVTEDLPVGTRSVLEDLEARLPHEELARACTSVGRIYRNRHVIQKALRDQLQGGD